MKDSECTAFLQEHLPRIRLRWAGFRKVRGQVCKRISRRLGELGIAGIKEYREYIEANPSEWEILYTLCRVTISRFYRDRGVFDAVRSTILASLARDVTTRGEGEVRAWSAGCASGEEAYTLRIIWELDIAAADPAAPPLIVTATDADAHLLDRAREGLYPASALKDMPQGLTQHAFDETAVGFTVRKRFKNNIRFLAQDIRKEIPAGPFHLVLCRNFVFTYFDESLQAEMLAKIKETLVPGGFLVIGAHETLPPHGITGIDRHSAPCIFRKRMGGRVP
jgi:chemotaxis protein methyltransferase CheR